MNSLERNTADKLLANIAFKISLAQSPCVEVEVYHQFLHTVALRQQVQATENMMQSVKPEPTKPAARLSFWKRFWKRKTS